MNVPSGTSNPGESSSDPTHGEGDAIAERLCSDLVERWQRGERVPVEAYFRQYSELENGDAAFELVLTEVVLRQSLGESPVLEEYAWRFPQFEERLRTHFSLQDGLIEPLPLSGSTVEVLAPAASSRGVPPEVFGYEILGELGRGGMGIVYEAHDTFLDRRVALKFLPHEYADDRRRLERFLREARTASALNHPHICTVHSLGEHQGRPFIVMERIEGATLLKLMRRRPEMSEIARIFGQAAQALAVAHAGGVVHRDIKPENIMVREDGYVKVLDFGLARRLPSLGDGKPWSQADTDPGTFLGTVSYMAPEQARGQPAQSSSDIFALGIVLYEVTTGRHPFESESALAMLHLIANCDPIAPSRLNPEIPRALEGLIEAMLHKEANLRPTAADVERALRSLGQEDSRHIAPVVSSHIVHRERELEVLRNAWKTADAGQGSLFCIGGEPGIGKTTLVEDFFGELTLSHPGCFIARGHCSERLAGTEAYFPVIDALGDLLRTDASGSAVRLMKFLAPSWHTQAAPPSPPSHSAKESTEAKSQQAMMREFSTLLQETSRVGTLVLFFDDIHWADVSTVDLLAHIGRICDTMRVLIIVTYRPTELLLGPHPFHQVRQELQMRGHCTELCVSFLSRPEIDHYLSLAFPGHNFSKDFTELIYARTEGSPLFLADLLRDLRERGVIAESGGRWVIEQALPSLQQELPESVRSMIQRKLDRLKRDDRQLLTAASVQGHEFDSAVVAEATGQDPADVEERFKTLDQIHGVIRLVRESEFPDRTLTVRYAFVHILYQQALFHDLPPSRRSALGVDLAKALERRQGEGSTAAAELACLYEVGRDFAQSARQFHLAAQNAARVFAHREAIALAKRGLRLLEAVPDSGERAALELALQTTLGMQLQVTDGFAAPDARQAYLRAYELCQHTPNSAPLFPVLWGLWLHSKVRSELDRAREMANELQQLACRLRDPDLSLQAHQALGMTAFCQGRPAEAVQHVEQVSTLYDPHRHRRHAFMFGQDPAVICKAYGAVSLWLLGYADQAKRQSEEAIRMSRHLSPSSQTVALHFAAMLHQLRREGSQVETYARESSSIAAEHGFSFWLAGGNILTGWAQADSGRWSEGVNMLRNGLTDWMATDSVTYQTYFLGLLAEVLAGQGRTAEGLSVLEEALTLVEQTGERLYEAELHRLRGELLLNQQDPNAIADESKHCFHRAIVIAREQQALALELRAALSAARLAHRQGGLHDALPLLNSIHHRLSEGFDTPDYREAIALFNALK